MYMTGYQRTIGFYRRFCIYEIWHRRAVYDTYIVMRAYRRSASITIEKIIMRFRPPTLMFVNNSHTHYFCWRARDNVSDRPAPATLVFACLAEAKVSPKEKLDPSENIPKGKHEPKPFLFFVHACRQRYSKSLS